MYNRKSVIWAAYLGMLVFGIVMTTLGSILPSVIAHFGIDLSRAGSLVSLLSGGILGGSILFGPVVDRYGYKALLVLCAALIALGLEGIAFAPSFAVLQVSIVLIGFGGGVINGGTNALVSDLSEEGRSAGLSLLGVFYGVGAFSIPFLLGLVLERDAYAAPIAAVGALTFCAALYFLLVRFPQPKLAQGFPIRDGLQLIREGTLLLLGLMLFLQSGMEMTVGNWTTSFLTTELGLDASGAALCLSFFLVGMTLARLAMGSLLKKIAPAQVLRACLGFTVVGALTMIGASTVPLAVAGLFLVGTGLAAGFPVVLGYVGDCYTRLSGTAFSIVLVIALAGGSLFPYLIGLLGEAFGLRASFGLLPASAILMALLLSVVLHRMDRVGPGAHTPA